MRIALDYDKTYTADTALWDSFIELAGARGHEVVCITMRRPDESIELPCPVIFTSRQAKVPFAEQAGLSIDIWIDDAPHWLLFDG